MTKHSETVRPTRWRAVAGDGTGERGGKMGVLLFTVHDTRDEAIDAIADFLRKEMGRPAYNTGPPRREITVRLYSDPLAPFIQHPNREGEHATQDAHPTKDQTP